jgi:predicted nucleotidyltransferase
MVDESVVKVVRTYLRVLQEKGIVVRFGVVFGSQAVQQAGEWSDIDLLVVSPTFDGPANRRDIDLLWRVSARVDSRIEPFPCGAEQWEEDDSSAMIEIARRHGDRVAV